MPVEQIGNSSNFKLTVPAPTQQLGNLAIGNASSSNQAVNLSVLGTILGATTTPSTTTPFVRFTTGIVLVAGTKVVADTSITSSSVVIPVYTAFAGTTGTPKVVINAGVGYTITSSNAADTGTLSAVIFG